MTLPTTGAISLAMLRDEYGQGNPVRLGDYYAGGGIVPSGSGGYNGAIPTSGAISLWNFRGHTAPPPYLDQQTITVGNSFTYYQQRWGYYSVWSLGSVSDGTSNIYGGQTIQGLMWSSSGLFQYFQEGTPASISNSGWSTLTVGGLSLGRAGASQFNQYSTNSVWVWSGTANPFSSVGQVVTATWT